MGRDHLIGNDIELCLGDERLATQSFDETFQGWNVNTKSLSLLTSLHPKFDPYRARALRQGHHSGPASSAFRMLKAARDHFDAKAKREVEKRGREEERQAGAG